MANLDENTISIELKEGIFFKLIKNKMFKFILSVLPYKWIKWLIAKSLLYKIGKYGKWHRFSRDLIF